MQVHESGPAAGLKQLTLTGKNDKVSASPDGKKIIFVSSSRPSHRNSQIYEMTLQSGFERRITFQDGEVFDPTYIRENEFLYASTTDEIKENIDLPRSVADKSLLPPSEVYRNIFFENEIERLTQINGYDGEPVYVGAAYPYILLVSHRGGRPGIWKYGLRSKASVPLSVQKDLSQVSPAVSSDTKSIAWLAKSEGAKTSQIYILLNNKTLTKLADLNGEIQHLSFVPGKSQLIYAIAKSNSGDSKVELFDIENKCSYNIYSSPYLANNPVYLDSPARVIFSLQIGDSQQLYMKDVPDDLGPCTPPAL